MVASMHDPLSCHTSVTRIDTHGCLHARSLSRRTSAAQVSRMCDARAMPQTLPIGTDSAESAPPSGSCIQAERASQRILSSGGARLPADPDFRQEELTRHALTDKRQHGVIGALRSD
eukprot:361252-Chlamydomonas_euryale.AAC.7